MPPQANKKFPPVAKLTVVGFSGQTVTVSTAGSSPGATGKNRPQSTPDAYASWSIQWGDGSAATAGTGTPPTNLTHTYAVGVVSAVVQFTVVSTNTLRDTIGITVEIDTVIPPPPIPTPPTVLSIVRATPSPTTGNLATWTVTFSEAVTGLTLPAFALANGGLTGPSLTALTGSGATYTVTAARGTGTGTLGLNLTTPAGIIDVDGTELIGTPFTGQTFTFTDVVTPQPPAPVTCQSINRVSASPTTEVSVAWTVTFSAPVTGVGPARFALAMAGGVSGATLTSVVPNSTTPSSVFTVTANRGSGDGTLGLNLTTVGSIIDGAGTALSGVPVTGQIYDMTTPTIPPPNPGPTPPAGVLTQADFTYLGFYDWVDGTTGAGLGIGIAHRYVSGQLRFLGQSLESGWQELLPPASFGGQLTRTGPTFALAGSNNKTGVWWDPDGTTLWMNSAIDYPADAELNFTSAITKRTINAAGAVSNFQGYWGYQNVSQRAIYGGMRHVPTWFQSANSVGPYLVGFGGYTSRMAQGMVPSLGPMFILSPDPSGFATQPFNQVNGGISAASWKFGADFRSGTTGSQWWPGQTFAARTRDRGSRGTTDIVNWFDGNAQVAARPVYPTDLKTPQFWWTSQNGGPAPNDPRNYARWTWGDTYNGACEWIDNDAGTRTRRGIVAVASMVKGYAWYMTSDLYGDDREYEIQVFDPADVAAVVQGTMPAYRIQPATAFSIRNFLVGIKTGLVSGSSAGARQVIGTTFDATTNRLYIAMLAIPNGVNAAKMRIYVFQVGGA